MPQALLGEVSTNYYEVSHNLSNSTPFCEILLYLDFHDLPVVLNSAITKKHLSCRKFYGTREEHSKLRKHTTYLTFSAVFNSSLSELCKFRTASRACQMRNARFRKHPTRPKIYYRNTMRLVQCPNTRPILLY